MADELEKLRSHADACAVCGKKFGIADKLHRNAYSHILMDAVPCEQCHRKLWRLLMHQKIWADMDALKQAMGKLYDYRKEYTLPLEKAKCLLALRDERCEQALRELGTGTGVFVVMESFQVVPSPAIFILRARKVRNKAVIKGFPLRGEFKKGGTVVLKRNGAVTETEIVDAVPCGTSRFSRETFYDNLGTNVHDHTLSECEEGWLILNIEADQLLPKGELVAGNG